MANRVMLDVENVFFWASTPEAPKPDAGHLSWMRECLDALVWWSDAHWASTRVDPPTTEAIRGYGKRDASGQAFIDVLRAWSPSAQVERDDVKALKDAYFRSQDATDPTAAKTARKWLATLYQSDVLQVRVGSTLTATFTPVGADPHAGETALLADIAFILNASPAGNRIVLCSRDGKVTRLFAEQSGDTFLLAYHPGYAAEDANLRKDARHAGDPRVAPFNVLVEVHRHRDRLPDLVPGQELTAAVLERIDLVGHAAPGSRPERTPAHPAPRDPEQPDADAGPDSPAIDEWEPLLAVDWAAVGFPATWAASWPDPGLAQEVGIILTRELDDIAAINTGLATLVAGFRTGAGDAAGAAEALEKRLLLIQAVTILALARRTRPTGVTGYGRLLRSDPRLHRFLDAYELIQPAIGRDVAADR